MLFKSSVARSKLSKENHKLYLVTDVYGNERVWKKSSLVHYCNRLYGVSVKDFLGKYRGEYKGQKIKPYDPKAPY